jgi:Holliday junction DNA helicase RuvA
MIARLHGRLVAIEAEAVVLDVAGVGYRVHVPTTLLADLGPEGTTATLHTHLYVRETEMTLFGAAVPEAMTLFSDLLSVSGVGPRVAMAMLSTFDVATLQAAIVGGDVALLTEVPGIGKKTAQRLILDLKSKLEAAGVPPGLGTSPTLAAIPENEDALAALQALGFPRGEARRALVAAEVAAEATVEERITAALRAMSR